MDPVTYNSELDTLSPDLRESIVSLAQVFLENYKPGQCDCDRSVGIFTCAACAARWVLNIDAWNNPIRDESDTG
jgi:hypothetical protein